MDRWVLSYDVDSERSWVPGGLRVQLDETVVAGRQGEVPLGVEVADGGISREAVILTATAQGWIVDVRNRNGAVIHPWGQAPVFTRGREALAWPRIGVRVLNGARPTDDSDPFALASPRPGFAAPGERASTYAHWLLLESDSVAVTSGGAQTGKPTATSTTGPRGTEPLTDRQREALMTVFADHLRWPPMPRPQARQLVWAARRMGMAANGLQNLLDRVIGKARQHGLHSDVRRTEPDYLYALVRAGYLAPPTTRLFRRILR